MIILHGLLGMLDNWHSFSKKLSEDYWVLAIDQRNHGKSEHSDDFDYNILSRDLEQFLEEKGIVKCHLIGHSMGGKTVMQFVHDYPEKVDRAIVVDIAPVAYKGGHEKIFNALLSVEIDKVTERSQVQDQLMEALNNKAIVLFLMKNLSRNPDGSYRWKANIQALYDNYDNILKNCEFDTKIDKKVLFVKGEKSDYIENDQENNIEKYFPGSRIVTIDDAGHWVHADQADQLLEVVRHYFSE